jgi:UDP-N-acetylglucosamine pyrophosphorylase
VLTNQEEYFNKGLNIIRDKKVAVVLMAGGQGTRLGHNGPKGTFDIGLPSGKSLFQIQTERLIRLKEMTGATIKWYIMTSEDNDYETRTFFEKYNYFGYDQSSVIFFKQDRLPLILEDGQIALKNKTEINLAANGNGGVFTSLKSNGIIEEMKNDGVQYIYLYGVDNAIARVADPTLIALAEESQNDIVSKAVEKILPEERVGLMCYKNGKPSIVEYSELDDEMRFSKKEDGKLLYNAANILQHVFTIDFLEKCSVLQIPYHKAYKKVSYYTDKLNEPSEPNGFKFELFMFDVFTYANDMSVLLVEREKEFTPVKNATGNDSPESARRMILDEHKRWLIESDADSMDSVEIDFKQSYKGENI